MEFEGANKGSPLTNRNVGRPKHRLRRRPRGFLSVSLGHPYLLMPLFVRLASMGFNAWEKPDLDLYSGVTAPFTQTSYMCSSRAEKRLKYT